MQLGKTDSIWQVVMVLLDVYIPFLLLTLETTWNTLLLLAARWVNALVVEYHVALLVTSIMTIHYEI